MIWDHIKTQVDSNILDSPYRFYEIQEALAEHDWYKREPFDRWVWGMGHKLERVELTFTQMVGFWRCEGYTTAQIDDRMQYLRYQISRTVDELIANDHMVETNEMVEEDVAA